MKENKLPKWFNGTVYDQGDSVTNPFSGESYELNNLELSVYDLIIGINTLNVWTDKTIDLHQKSLKWFRTNNPKAYMVLLD